LDGESLKAGRKNPNGEREEQRKKIKNYRLSTFHTRLPIKGETIVLRKNEKERNAISQDVVGGKKG